MRSISLITCSVTSVGMKKVRPPCTTRCPTARKPTVARSIPPSANSATTRSKAVLWSGSSICSVTSVPFCSWVIDDPRSPIRSHSPSALTTSVSGCTSWYFSDDEPALRTSTAPLIPV